MQSQLTFILRNFTLKAVSIQLIQTANILAHNLSDFSSKEYLLSTAFYSEIVSFPFDFGDDEVIENYISLLKGLAVNLHQELLKWFLVNKEFKLYTGALIFLNYQEPMIRTGARTVILNIFKSNSHLVPDEQIRKYVLESGFFANLVTGIREQWIELDREITQITNISRMDAVMIDNLDNLYYINDIFELEIQEFNEEIGDLLLRIVLLPIVIGGFTSYDRKPYHISISLSTYILIQTIQMLKYKPLIDTLVATIFLTEICEEIIELILDPPPLIIIKRDKRSIDTLKIGFFMIEALDNLEKPESLIANPVRTVLLSFLRSRDDTLVTLILKLIDVVMWHEDIDKSTLKHSGLWIQDQSSVNNPENQLLDGNDIENFVDACYNSDLVNPVLSLMRIRPPFRPTTCQLSAKIVMNLTYKKQPNKCLLPHDEATLNHALWKQIKHLKRILNGNAYNGLLFLESFEDEYISANSFNFRQPIDIPSYILIPFISENVPYNLRNPNSEIETTKLNMYLFFLYRRLRISLCKIDFNSEIDSGTYPIKALRKIIELKVGESYEMSNLDTGNRNLIRCSYKDGKSETLKYMAEDDNYFILVDPDPFINDQYKIFFISNLRNLEATVYNSDPKSLCLAVKFKKDNLSITLTFEDSQRCAWAKNKIEVNRKVSKDFDLGLIGSMFDSYQYMLKMHKTHIIN